MESACITQGKHMSQRYKLDMTEYQLSSSSSCGLLQHYTNLQYQTLSSGASIIRHVVNNSVS